MKIFWETIFPIEKTIFRPINIIKTNRKEQGRSWNNSKLKSKFAYMIVRSIGLDNVAAPFYYTHIIRALLVRQVWPNNQEHRSRPRRREAFVKDGVIFLELVCEFFGEKKNEIKKCKSREWQGEYRKKKTRKWLKM